MISSLLLKLKDKLILCYNFGEKHFESIVQVPWCMLYIDDIVLIHETKRGINSKLEFSIEALESKFEVPWCMLYVDGFVLIGETK